MAKGRVRNRMELREQAEAAEARQQAERGTTAEAEEPAEAEAPAKKKKKAATPKEPRTRKKVVKVVRQRVIWGVFDNSNKKVQEFEYTQKQAAIDYAERMKADKKTTYFVQPIKVAITE